MSTETDPYPDGIVFEKPILNDQGVVVGYKEVDLPSGATERVAASDIGPAVTDALAGWGFDFGRFSWSATHSTDGNAVLVDVADPTGPNGQRSFVVEFSVREVT